MASFNCQIHTKVTFNWYTSAVAKYILSVCFVIRSTGVTFFAEAKSSLSGLHL